MGRRPAELRLAALHNKASKVGDEVATNDVIWAARNVPGLARKLREHALSLGVDFSQKKQKDDKKEPVDEDTSTNHPDDIPHNEDDRIPASETKLPLLKPQKLQRICEALHADFFNEAVWRALTPKGRRIVPKDPMVHSIALLTGWPESRTFGGIKSLHFLISELKNEQARLGCRAVGKFRLPLDFIRIGVFAIEIFVQQRQVQVTHQYSGRVATYTPHAKANMEKLALNDNHCETGAYIAQQPLGSSPQNCLALFTNDGGNKDDEAVEADNRDGDADDSQKQVAWWVGLVGWRVVVGRVGWVGWVEVVG